MPQFSVIIPTYNRAELLVRAIHSVIQQTYKDWELIVVDDGSTDDTSQRLSSYEPGGKLVIINQPNSGRSAARNAGIKAAKGEFICFLDSDDEYLPEHLETLNELIVKNGSAVGLYKTLGYLVKNGRIVPQEVPEYTEGTNPLHYMLTYVFYVPSVCIHRSILRGVKFNTDISFAEDTEFFMRILAHYPLFQSGRHTFHVHASETVLMSSESIRIHREYIVAFKRILGLPELAGKYQRMFLRQYIRKRCDWIAAEYKKCGNWPLFVYYKWKKHMN